MGSVFKVKNKHGYTWKIAYYVNGEQKKEKVGRERDGITERMAKEALKAREGDIARNKFDLAQIKTYPCFDKALDEYLEYSKAHKKAYERDVTSSKHLKPYFGNKRINEINPFLIEKYKMSRKEEIRAKHPDKDEKDISFASINRELALMKHFYSMMVKWGKIDQNPVKGIKMFKEKLRERYLEEHEIEALLNAATGRLRVILLIALNTGMRLREVLHLKAQNVDFKNSIITIEHTKNGERGKVEINDFLKEVLREYLEGHETEYLFPGKDGKPLNDVRTAFKNALKKAGITNFRFHDTRHTFGSWLAMKGVDTYTIQRLGRWKTPAMVMRYAHLSPKHRQMAANTLGSLFNPKSSPNSEGAESQKVVGLRNAAKSMVPEAGVEPARGDTPRDFENNPSLSYFCL